MVLKRHFKDKGDDQDEGSDSAKRRRFISDKCKGLNHCRILQESLPCLETLIRKWVREELERSLEKFLRPSYDQVEGSRSRSLQLLFHNSLPDTLFTGSKIMSEDKSPMKVILHDSNSKEIITCGPLSSLKVAIVVLDGDFGRNDVEDWTKNEFDSKIVKSREGKRPLVAGELIVTLQSGVGYINDLIFTDNSSWIRSRRFRLGVKVHTNSDEIGIREAMSNPFIVKDQRGEPNQKHYPPSLDDELWRLEKIARDGPSHNVLTQSGIFSVGDLLRLYATNQYQLRTILKKVSNRTWETIIRHATTCSLDDKRYIFRTRQGIDLLFNSVYYVIGVSFDGQDYRSVETLNTYEMRVVEDLKQHAYENLNEWVLVSDPLTAGYPMLLANPSTDGFANPNVDLHSIDFQELDDQLAPPYNCSFEVGESSNSMQSLSSPTLGNSFGMSEHYCSQGNNNGLFVVDSFGGNREILSDRRSKMRWCKVLAVVKWRILVRRNVAARRWNSYFSYMETSNDLLTYPM